MAMSRLSPRSGAETLQQNTWQANGGVVVAAAAAKRVIELLRANLYSEGEIRHPSFSTRTDNNLVVAFLRGDGDDVLYYGEVNPPGGFLAAWRGFFLDQWVLGDA
ncbi:hypothetical protein HYFRA_00004914 [Hymenoscyphus fraxineus]|uniref:Uncharacterized protein n=1 Tax=Hymenoscyphus fraxineus TaxID=746836 RepID=A0A9N9KKD5_9HELO|nr:hypothetical protein HYFRA_00004914 [Hymenoscyphus fraxineus]